jgi:hypothetical protein
MSRSPSLHHPAPCALACSVSMLPTSFAALQRIRPSRPHHRRELHGITKNRRAGRRSHTGTRRQHRRPSAPGGQLWTAWRNGGAAQIRIRKDRLCWLWPRMTTVCAGWRQLIGKLRSIGRKTAIGVRGLLRSAPLVFRFLLVHPFSRQLAIGQVETRCWTLAGCRERAEGTAVAESGCGLTCPRVGRWADLHSR